MENENSALLVKITEFTKIIHEQIVKLSAAEDFTKSLDDMLCAVGSYINADRVFIFEKKGEFFQNTHEWYNEGISSQLQNFTNLADPVLNFLLEQLKESSCVKIKDIESIKDISPLVYDFFALRKVSNTIIAPVIINGKVCGFFGMDNLSSELLEPLEHVLCVMATLIGGIVQLRVTKEVLEQEPVTYKDAILGDCEYNFVCDLMEGTVNKEIVTASGDKMIEMLGMRVPVSYDELNARFKESYNVVFPNNDMTSCFTCEGLLEWFDKGKTNSTVEYHDQFHDKYIRCQILLSKNTVNDHVFAAVIAKDISKIRKAESEHERQLADAVKRAETFARRAQENLDLLDDVSGSGMWYFEYDEDGNRTEVFWSQYFRKLLGFKSKKEFPDTYEAWEKRIHPDCVEQVKQAMADAIKNKTSYEIKYRLKKSDGRYTWFCASGRVVCYKNGGPRLMIGSLTDISSQLETERLRSIIDAIANIYFAVFSVDVKNNVVTGVSTKEYIQKLLGSSGPALHMFSKMCDYLVQEDFKDDMRVFTDIRTLNSRMRDKSFISLDYKGVSSGWSRGYFIEQERDENGNLEKVVYVCLQIKEEKERELEAKRALEDAYESANRANAAKSEFLTNMSHDIRTPMNAIVGMTAIAGVHIDNKEKVLDCLSKIDISSKHLLGIINEVLDMSKIESGKMDLTVSDFNFSDLIENCLTIIKPLIEQKHHELIVDIHDLEHEYVKGDSQRIQQAFMNLITNSINYTPEHGKIRISLTERPTHRAKIGCFEFAFEDNGIGMTPDFLAHAFDPFARARDARIGKWQGTGLGLAITRNVVRMMNGDIRVESQLGKGTKFIVTIYLELQDNKANYDDLKDLSVLLVGSDKAYCESAVSMINEIGMKGEYVLSGREAVEKVNARHSENNDYFAVLLDWKMPDMDGIETTKEIRNRVKSNVPVVLVSAYDWAEVESVARTAGVYGFLSKPLFKSRLAFMFHDLQGKSTEDSSSYETALSSISESDFSGKRVLLVEDNELNAEIAKEIFEMACITVENAWDGKQAVEMMSKVKSGYYDMIFMDIQMPVMDGYEATTAIRAMDGIYQKQVPIIAMTANAFAEDVQQCYKVGMNEHIAKPIDFNQLKKVLKRWLKYSGSISE